MGTDAQRYTHASAGVLRRVVAGVGGDGRSCVASDGPLPVAYRYPAGAMAAAGTLGDTRPPAVGEGLLTEVWAAAEAPGRSPEDPTHPDPVCQVECRPGEVKWRLVRFGPDRESAMHATATLDCNVVVEGELELLLETETVRLGPGDAVVLPGVVHGWRSGPSGCTMSVTMVGLAATTREGGEREGGER